LGPDGHERLKESEVSKYDRPRIASSQAA
jgi:hypothetical protein